MNILKLNFRHVAFKLFVLLFLLFVINANTVNAQEWRWLRIGELQSYFSDRGAEAESEGYDGNSNQFSWPAQYGVIEQTTVRQRGMWIGSKNFYDPLVKDKVDYKVVGVGPRECTERQYMIFEQSIKVYGKEVHPAVTVDDQDATVLTNYETLDEVVPDLPCDRMIVIKFNTSIGVSVTKKIMAFSRPDHSNYFIYDYVFKNTGIYNRKGDVYEQALEDVYFYYMYRYAFSGESLSSYSVGWGANTTSWGANTINHAFGNNPLADVFNDPNSPYYKMRAFYSFYGPNSDRPVTFEEDWGCPNQLDDGVLGSAKYSGCVTLHADKAVSDRADNLYQPATTWYVSSDEGVWSADVSQIDKIFMQQRYRFMSEGHPPQSHAQLIAANYLYAQEFQEVDSDRNVGGGTSQGQGYGPYDMAIGDSVHIVFAEGIAGLGREINREVGGKWLQYYKGNRTATLLMPDGFVANDHNAYKRAWVETGMDSILKTFRNAINNYESGYTLPAPPPPPTFFTVKSGGDRIRLSWDQNASTWPNFNGYEIYRSEGNVMEPKTVYKKIFECSAANVVHTFDDTTAVRGFNYYYYIQSKDNGALTDGKSLKSGLFWTVTSVPAYLRRPAHENLADIRVVPNPYDLRARAVQFGDDFQYDRIAFYGLPPECNIKIFTERGDLIWEREHNDGSGDELWDSLTSSGQIIVSGIYIAYFETPAGESVYRKFVVIR
ncbi:MAG TPA: hypothetical protein PLP19_19345 [bacterium]|nr:hypothetical protein [bacterium]HPN45652.1 hypothetical protein [bacterium]